MHPSDIQPEVAKGSDLWSIFDLMNFTPDEAYAVYQEAAQHDISFSFPVTLKDKDADTYNLLFRCAPAARHLPSLLHVWYALHALYNGCCRHFHLLQRLHLAQADQHKFAVSPLLCYWKLMSWLLCGSLVHRIGNH